MIPTTTNWLCQHTNKRLKKSKMSGCYIDLLTNEGSIKPEAQINLCLTLDNADDNVHSSNFNGEYEKYILILNNNYLHL